MSFLESGKTVRTTFNQMPPKRHDLDTSKSEVLAYICEQMGCDLSRAIRVFNSMRHPKCRVLVFDKMERQWKGCEFRPSDAETSELSIIREHRSFERQLSVLKSAMRRMQGDIENLKRKASARPKWKKGGKNAENTESEPKLEQEPEEAKESSEPSLADEFEKLLSDLKAS